MKYARIEEGQKLHLVCEAGEGYRGQVIPDGYLSLPFCGRLASCYCTTTDKTPPSVDMICGACVRILYTRGYIVPKRRRGQRTVERRQIVDPGQVIEMERRVTDPA